MPKNPKDRPSQSERKKQADRASTKSEIRAQAEKYGGSKFGYILAILLLATGLIAGFTLYGIQATSANSTKGTTTIQYVNQTVTVTQNVSIPIAGDTIIYNANASGDINTNIYGNSTPVGNVSQILLVFLGMNTTLFHQYIDSGNLQLAIQNMSILLELNLGAVMADGSFPVTSNATFPVGTSIMPGFMSFIVTWNNGTVIDYHVNFLGGLAPSQIVADLPNFTCENGSTYFIQFGGFHHIDDANPLGDFDYAPFDFNGFYLDCPISLNQILSP